jgi:hypothetical protein
VRRAHEAATVLPAWLPTWLAQVSGECVGAALRRMAPAALAATLESWLEGVEGEQRQQAALMQDMGGSPTSRGDILAAVCGGPCEC